MSPVATETPTPGWGLGPTPAYTVIYTGKLHHDRGRYQNKPWAIRNIKLVFSRKLIYASGLFSVAMTADRSHDAKVEILEKLFSMTPLDRLIDICGESRTRGLVKSYNLFLSRIDDAGTRAHLEELQKNERDTDAIFRELKNEGYHFASELMMAFEKTFHSTHPIHRAVIF